ncbi:MAG: long-chain fatty acid--CoA ligase [bacterium]|nr:long-chain fatty acid--CoA ligase [bacterium]
MTLGEMLERSAEKYPDKIAIVFKDQQVKYKELDADANRLGRALNALGIEDGDKVGILMPNCPEFVMGVFAALKAGAVFVALNGLLSGRELTYVINNSDTKVILAAAPYDGLLAMLKPQLPKVQHILTLDDNPEEEELTPFRPLMEAHDDSNLKPTVDLSDPAAIYYSSGTTGLPKGAVLTHVNILSSTVAIGKAVNASRKDVPLCCLPMFHTLAMTACVMVPIFAGMTNVLLETFLPQPVLKGFSDWEVTIFVGVPTMFAVLANMPNLERYNISKFRLGYCGGAPLTTAIAEKFESKFPAEIYEGYGLSECAPLVSVNPLGNRKIGSIGKAADRVSWKILDMAGKEVPRNAVGEIAVSGPNVMIGYYNDEEATKACIKGEEGIVINEEALKKILEDGVPKDVLAVVAAYKNKRFGNENFFLATLGKKLGKEKLNAHKNTILQHTRQRWFLTGDLGYMDDDGFAFIADRKKDMIIVGGENVYPKEVENVLTQHPAIDDAGVIGADDPIRGEVPKAFIVPKLGATIDEKDVLEFCRQNLAGYKVPRAIEVIDEIPKNVTGKILKRALRRIDAGLPPEEEEDDLDGDEEIMEVDDSEVESVDEVEDTPAPPAGGMSVEEQMRLLEGGGMPAPPSDGGMNLDEQMRQMEGGGGMPPADGMSLEDQMRQMEAEAGGGMGSASPAPEDVPDYTPGDGVDFEEHLRNLVMEVPGGIVGSISGYDGIGIASFSNDPDFEMVIADAEMASVMGAIKKAAESLQAGNPMEAYFLSGRFGFIIKAIGPQYFVTIILEASELNWGLTRLQVNKIVPFIERELF